MNNWTFSFAEMWERLWDLLIYPILALFGYVKDADGNLVTTEAAE